MIKNKDTFNETDKETNGGYVKVNRYVYYENDGKTDKYDIFNNQIFKSLNIVFDNGNGNVSVTPNEDGKSFNCAYDGIDITMEINEEDEEYKIPIPFVDTEYTVKLTTLIDNCKLPTEIKVILVIIMNGILVKSKYLMLIEWTYFSTKCIGRF